MNRTQVWLVIFASHYAEFVDLGESRIRSFFAAIRIANRVTRQVLEERARDDG